MQKKPYNKETEGAKFQSAIDNSNDSRNSTHGYLETGNPAEVHAKARAMRNNNNRTDTVDE